MSVSQKCQYALRAILELARHHGGGPTSIREIARAQAIPPRFLEVILTELRKGGFVESRRGVHGGYLLAASPPTVSAGQIIRFIDGPIVPVRCLGSRRGAACPLYENCAFVDMWTRARDAVTEIYESTTLQDLIHAQLAASGKHVASYCI